MTKVKLCGITRSEDAILAVRLGYDYLGFVIDSPKSLRSISIGHLKEINDSLVVAGLRNRVKLVGVFVDAPIEYFTTAKVFELCDVSQLHGNESVEYCQRLQGKGEVWKALVKRTGQSTEDYKKLVKDYLTNANKVLIDSATAQDKLAGSKVTDYDELLSCFDFSDENLILSGGINLENINRKLKKINPRLVDLSSGVESAPGIKDQKKLTEFIYIINKYNGKT